MFYPLCLIKVDHKIFVTSLKRKAFTKNWPLRCDIFRHCQDFEQNVQKNVTCGPRYFAIILASTHKFTVFQCNLLFLWTTVRYIYLENSITYLYQNNQTTCSENINYLYIVNILEFLIKCLNILFSWIFFVILLKHLLTVQIHHDISNLQITIYI